MHGNFTITCGRISPDFGRRLGYSITSIVTQRKEENSVNMYLGRIVLFIFLVNSIVYVNVTLIEAPSSQPTRQPSLLSQAIRRHNHLVSLQHSPRIRTRFKD